jgi:hypothetical protein
MSSQNVRNDCRPHHDRSGDEAEFQENVRDTLLFGEHFVADRGDAVFFPPDNPLQDCFFQTELGGQYRGDLVAVVDRPSTFPIDGGDDRAHHLGSLEGKQPRCEWNSRLATRPVPSASTRAAAFISASAR